MRCSIALAGALVLSNVAAADIVLVTDTRLVRAEAAAFRNGASDVDGPNSDAAAFGAAFQGSALASALVGGASAGAAVSQNSSITATRITALGSVSLSASVLDDGTSSAAGRSLIDLALDLGGPTSIEILCSSTGVGTFELRDSSENILFRGPGIFRAVLAGRVRFLADANASYAAPPSGSDGGGFSVSMSIVPAPTSAATLLSLLALPRRRRRAT